MKIKNNKKTWFILTIIIMLGYIGLGIYQIINNDFDPLNLIVIIMLIDVLPNYLEKK